MTARNVNPEVAEMAGPAAPPRRNGELVFDALWEGRAFGMAVILSDQGVYPWRDFRDSLVEVIAGHDAAGDVTTPYYERFLAALEHLAVERGLVSKAELDTLTDEYVAKRAAQDAARAAADAEEAATEAGEAAAEAGEAAAEGGEAAVEAGAGGGGPHVVAETAHS